MPLRTEDGGLAVWAKVALGCAATAAANILAAGRQIGTFEERMTWMREDIQKNYAAHSGIMAEYQAGDLRVEVRVKDLEMRLRELELDNARGAK